MVVISDGRSPTYKGGPNFGAMIDISEEFDLKGKLLCFGAVAHINGPQDSIGKQPHTMAMSYTKQGKILFICSAQEMYDSCAKHMPGPSWIVKKQPASTGTMGGKSTFMWGFYNNELTLAKKSHVKNVAIAEGFNGGFEWDGLH